MKLCSRRVLFERFQRMKGTCRAIACIPIFCALMLCSALALALPSNVVVTFSSDVTPSQITAQLTAAGKQQVTQVVFTDDAQIVPEASQQSMDCSNLFAGMPQLKSVSATKPLNLDAATSLAGMFSSNPLLETVPLALVHPTATTTEDMFSGCSQLTSFVDSGSTLNLTEVSRMSHMFADCISLNSVPIMRANVGAVTPNVTCDYMFKGCTSFTDLDLAALDLSDATNLSITSMFSGCSSLVSLNLRSLILTTGATVTDSQAFSGVPLETISLSSSYVPSANSGFAFTRPWQPSVSATSFAFLDSRDDFTTFAASHPNVEITYKVGYPITFDGNGGTITVAGAQQTSYTNTFAFSAQVIAPAAADMSRTDFQFQGFADSASATQPTYDYNNPPYASEAPATYYAVWKSTTASVTFHAAPGSFSDTGEADKTVSGNLSASLEVPGNSAVSNTGFYLAGWALTQGASTPTIIPDDSSTIPTFGDAQGDYYAVWRADNTVVFSANGGAWRDGSTESTSMGQPTQALVFPAPNPEREYYTFIGWASSPSATTPETFPSGFTFQDAKPTYYAVWQAKIKAITFYSNGGVFSDTTETKSIDEAEATVITLPQSPTRSNYIFLGWGTAAGAKTPEIIPSQSDTIPYGYAANSSYYAVWQVLGHVLFDANGGQFASGATTLDQSGEQTAHLVLPEAPSRQNYMFVGWASTKSAVYPEYRPNTPSENLPTYADAPAQLWAVWIVLKDSIVFDANGGSYAGNPTTTVTGPATNLINLPTNPVRSGYEFLGYDEDPGAITPAILPGDESTYPTFAQSASTLYAIWIAENTVIFDANGGIFTGGARTQRTQGAGSTVIELPQDPSCTGYAFVGWATESSAQIPNMPNPRPTYATAANIYYAVWKRAYYTVTFYGNGGTIGGMASKSRGGEFSEQLTPPDETPERAGFVFLGWADAEEATNPQIIPGDSSTYPSFGTAKSTYYAVWELKEQGWVKDSNGWRYINATGAYLSDTWSFIDNCWYFFASDGYALQDGWHHVDTGWYYFTNLAQSPRGWILVNGTYYYVVSSGCILFQWAWIDNEWYYFNEQGEMATGWVYFGNVWYWCAPSGAMLKDGWYWIETPYSAAWYYLGVDGGCAQYQWIFDGVWYWCGASGAMERGWQFIEGHWYYLSWSGAMQTGWLWDNAWYYLGPSGAMVSGWVFDRGWWYYLNYWNGAMLTNTWIGSYWVDASGAWIA